MLERKTRKTDWQTVVQKKEWFLFDLKKSKNLHLNLSLWACFYRFDILKCLNGKKSFSL